MGHYSTTMVDKPNMDPNSPTPPHGPTASHKTPPKSDFKAPSSEHEKGGMSWLGMTFSAQEAKQLWNIISQSISTQIKKDQDRAIKALKKLNPDNPQDDDS